MDNACDVLVGKVPGAKEQADFITVALIYKFLADSDKNARDSKLKPRFFTGEYERFDWHQLLDTRKSDKERRELYAEALKKIPENRKVPEVFRTIFSESVLPFHDARILNLFLKEINEIPYERAEDLGTPYEYLLDRMGANKGAGNFRTPQHIIDFIVRVVDPQKEDQICDPACGTAGFLISAHEHIMRANGDKNPGDMLEPEDKRKLAAKWRGYDIDPGMVRLGMANAYIHNIHRKDMVQIYDSLTSTAHWDDKYDVILANPPFMTPKGGIQPHNRFAVRAKRSEVLFVDYIGRHLTPGGRAGVIVPEGIIFQTGKAYRQLRKHLVEDWGLYAVVSLPAGVFNPYSGIKTSVLLLDKTLAKYHKILFVNVANDGYDLGAQRRPINKNDLPQAADILRQWRAKQTIAKKAAAVAHAVEKKKIAEGDVYNLTGDYYRATVNYGNTKWPMVPLGEVLDYEQPTAYVVNAVDYSPEYATPVLTAGKTFVLGHTNETDGIFRNVPVIIFDDFTTATKFVNFPFKVKSSAMKILKPKDGVDTRFVFCMMQNIQFNASTHKRYWISQYSKIKIPLPPLEVQREIVAEIDGWQKIIDGAQQVADNWRPQITPAANWEVVRLADVCDIKVARPPQFKGEKSYYDTSAVGARGVEKPPVAVAYNTRPCRADCYPPQNAVGFAKMKGTHKTVFIDSNLAGAIFSTGFQFLTPKDGRVNPRFLYSLVGSDFFQREKDRKAPDGIMGSIALRSVAQLTVPLPSPQVQQKIADAIDAEQKDVDVCRKMIKSHQHKIAEKISELWHNDASKTAGNNNDKKRSRRADKN